MIQFLEEAPLGDKIRVILVEDERDLRESVLACLNHYGIEATGVGTCLEFYKVAAESSFSIAVVDLGLPDQSGYVLTEFIRRNMSMGVVILTGRDHVEDRRQGYECGADLYLVKPVDCRELSSAIKNLARRLAYNPSQATHGNAPAQWRLVKQSWHLISPAGAAFQLTAKEMMFLTSLAQVPDKPVKRETLLAVLGYADDEYANRAMDSLVRRLRRKIATSPAEPSPIKTIYSLGYSFSAPIVLV